jgi:hypothetical protein
MTAKKKYVESIEERLHQAQSKVSEQTVVHSLGYERFQHDKTDLAKKQSEVVRNLDAIKQSSDPEWETYKKSTDKAVEELTEATKNHLSNHFS